MLVRSVKSMIKTVATDDIEIGGQRRMLKTKGWLKRQPQIHNPEV